MMLPIDLFLQSDATTITSSGSLDCILMLTAVGRNPFSKSEHRAGTIIDALLLKSNAYKGTIFKSSIVSFVLTSINCHFDSCCSIIKNKEHV